MSRNERLNKTDLAKVYRRQFLIRAGLNFERQQCVGFTAALTPLIDKYYTDKEEKRQVMLRHMNLFLSQPMVASLPIGVALAMEERIALEHDIDPEAVNSVKTALMGPLAALGDSLINGTLRPLVAGIAITMAQQNNILGPILFLIVMSFTTLFVRYIGIYKGYEKGVEVVEDIHKSGLIEKLTDIASIAAYVIVGGFIPGVVSMALNISFTTGDNVLSIQEQLDGLMPGLLPVLLTLFMYHLISKKKVSTIALMFGLMLLGIVGVYLGIF